MMRLFPRTVIWLGLYCWLDRLAIVRGTDKGDSVKRIVFCRIDLLGDLMLQLPSLNDLAERAISAGYEVEVLCGDEFVSLLSGQLPRGVRCTGLDRTKFVADIRYRVRVLRSLSSTKHYAAVQLSWSRDLLGMDSVIRALDADTKIGMSGNYDNSSRLQMFIGDRFYSRICIPPSELVFQGEVDQWFAARVDEELSLGARLEIRRDKSRRGNDASRLPVFYVFPGTSRRTSFKRWPEEYFARVIDTVVGLTGWDCVIAGTAEEEEILHRTALSASATNVTVVAGTLSLSEIYSSLAQSSLVIGNDSGAVHMAAYAGTKALAICGGGHPDSFFPYPENYAGVTSEVRTVRKVLDCYGCGWHCNHQDREANTAYPCVSTIRVEDVCDQVENMLGIDQQSESR